MATIRENLEIDGRQTWMGGVKADLKRKAGLCVLCMNGVKLSLTVTIVGCWGCLIRVGNRVVGWGKSLH